MSALSRGDASAGLGRAIREAREKAGMTLRQLGEKLDLSAPFLSDVEHGRRGIAKLSELAKACGVTEQSLVRRSDVLTREEQAWINAHPEILKLLRDTRGRHNFKVCPHCWGDAGPSPERKRDR